MDDKTFEFLTKLADKLGTTAEMLWGVLMKQAVVAGFTSATYLVIFAALTTWAFLLVRRKTKCTTPATAANPYPEADWTKDAAACAWVVLAIWVVISLVVFAESFPVVMQAIFNPEYLALKLLLVAR